MPPVLGSDLRHTLRTLGKSPGFTFVAVLSLALGIGANTAMFGVVSTLLLTPLPVESPEELAIVAWRTDGSPSIYQSGTTSYEDPVGGAEYRSNFSYPLYRAIRGELPDGVDLFAFTFMRAASVAVDDQPAFLAGGALVDGRYFATLQPDMALGRPLDEEDDDPGAPTVAVLSHAFWMRTFGGDPDVLGRSVRVNGSPAEIVGVTAAGFHGMSMGGIFPRTSISLPLTHQPLVHPRMGPGGPLLASDGVFWVRLMARIPDDVSEASAEQALEAAFRAHPSPLLEDGTPSLRILPGSQGAQPIRSDRARLLWFLLGVVGIVLLIACVNLASLMLARGVSREREIAVRKALGAGRGRLVRGVLTESLVLSAAGTALGIGVVVALDDVLGALLAGSLGSGAFADLQITADLDPRVLALTALTGVAATLFFGLLPALRLSGVDPGAWLKSRTGAVGGPRLTLGRVLIAAQVGISLPLIVGAALFLRTVANLDAVELGFTPSGVASFPVDPGFTNRPPEENARLYQEVLAAVGEIRGVRSVTLMENVPLSGLVSNGTIAVDGRRVMLFRNAVGPALLETLGMRLLAGRMPGLQDGPDAPRIGVVNETAVREIFGGASPVGRMMPGLGGAEVRIVGVVNDTPYRDRRSGVPATLYESALQRDGSGGHHAVLRTEVPIAQLETAIRDAVYRVDADLPVPQIRTLTEFMAQTTARERVFTQLLSLFGGFALLLAAIGLHGVTSYSVSRRTHEIGVRMAVGAEPGQILRMILRQVLTLAAAGLIVGVPISLWAAPVAGSLLYGVAPNDVAAITGGALLMLGVASFAGSLPARRAARIGATEALAVE